jgi:Fe-S-cluster containining protein
MHATEAYQQFRDAVDRMAAELTNVHGKHVTCRPGCHSCCTNLSVFPVEYHAILAAIRQARVVVSFDPAQPCGFLRDGKCSLYAMRPLICRTHGLPVAFTNDTFEPPETNVSFCPMNFSEADLDDYEFGPRNTLDLDAMNSRLAEINQQYLAELPPSNRPPQRVPLSQLCRDLAIVTSSATSP